tara:strand:- start:12445 stop:13272 length:828 start_codon:yes stop_codon:yes gene_type:complete
MKVQHQSSVQAIIYMIDNCGMSPSDIENKTKISRTQVYRWRDGTVKKVRTSSLFSVAKALGFKIHHINNTITTTRDSDNNTIVSKGDQPKMEQQFLYEHIGLLKEKINIQEKKIITQNDTIKELKNIQKQKRSEEKHWNELTWNHIVNVQLIRTDILHFGRTITKVSKLPAMAQRLGYTINEMENYWAIGIKYDDMSKHPINKIIDQTTADRLERDSKLLPKIFDALKAFVQKDHYIPMPVMYKHKDGSNISTLSYNKINWNDMTVKSKLEFLNT